MADERLRDLERRFRASGALADRLALLRERVRLHDRPTDRMRLSLLEYDPAPARAAVTRYLEERLPPLIAPQPRDEATWKGPLVNDVNALLGPLTGPWFEGLGQGFGMERWCRCHRFLGYQEPPRLDLVPKTVDDIVAFLDGLHRFHTKLLELSDETTFDADVAATMRELTQRVVTLVVDETGCDDAWYGKPLAALKLVLADKGVVLPEARLEELHRIIDDTFESWIAPPEEAVAVVADAAALAIAWATFEARYGRA
jgi:hypothetical protein